MAQITLIPNTRNAMVDLESLGNDSDAAIFALGAVKFNTKRGVFSKFYQRIDLQSCLDVGMTINAQTIHWWFEQEAAVRAEFRKDAKSIFEVLELFTKWLRNRDTDIWGNGAAFDNVVLKNTYQACDMEVPWDYWNDKCFRTIKSAFKHVEHKATGKKHHALTDAKNQALHLLKIDSTL